MRQLDSDLLRSFLAVTDAGSITGGAQTVHRSQSAVSLQVGQLEELLGKPVFVRHGRGVGLTEAGEALLPVARQVVQTLDRTRAEIGGTGLGGRLRIGIPEEQGAERLPDIIGRFARSHPAAELIVRCANSADFPAALVAGKLDMAIHEVETVKENMTLLREIPLGWVGSRAHPVAEDGTLPVALFDRACWWREAAIRSLENCERGYRVVLTSEGAGGIAAAIEAGIAVGLLDCSSLPKDLVPLTAMPGLGEIPPAQLVLEIAATSVSPLAKAMAEAVVRSYSETIA
ncbi:hypothetical protein BV394_04045 [Brevirhabdus pacifica]|uniref:Uncharacterized protein n=1 Tax=Brevirhabdus pacifica TaxID=1267768 RepID=A0A1U7DGJ8_9RHOB|nr:LysR family transcriptional regulator [Brevirhabdus pacifica]APX88998.1 hypothetical protein BV394_04045 [Brevirhabdus pacifica]OWU80217.1 hypothetical protein ATO5_04725 [Loktanella sp. 22II-4b]PJJ86436.1 DNA-binding transcriptional LysR family regulator [Brevirhabdus pacifica]